MTAPISIQKAYLPNTRSFPGNITLLTDDLSKSYIEIAQAVNFRTIGIFDKFQVVTGERWFNDADNLSKRQTYRQVYTIPASQLPILPAANATFAHNIQGLVTFTRMYGTCITDTPDYRPIPYASVAANNNIDLRVAGANIIVANGTDPAAPIIESGIIVLEYLLN